MVSVEEARKILGIRGQDLSDEEIQKMLKLFHLFANLCISNHIAEKKSQPKASLDLVKSL